MLLIHSTFFFTVNTDVMELYILFTLMFSLDMGYGKNFGANNQTLPSKFLGDRINTTAISTITAKDPCNG